MPRQAYLFNGVPTRLRSRITETGSPQILSYSEFHHIIGAAFFMSYNESRQASRDAREVEQLDAAYTLLLVDVQALHLRDYVEPAAEGEAAEFQKLQEYP